MNTKIKKINELKILPFKKSIGTKFALYYLLKNKITK